MFEDFYYKHRYTPESVVRLKRLLLRHNQLKRYEDVVRRLSPELRKKVKKPKHKHKLLAALRHDLADRIKPEETFEIWHQYSNLNTYRSSSKDLDFNRKYNDDFVHSLIGDTNSDDDDDENDENDENDNNDDNDDNGNDNDDNGNDNLHNDDDNDDEYEDEYEDERTKERNYRTDIRIQQLMNRSGPVTEKDFLEFMVLTQGFEIFPNNFDIGPMVYHSFNLKFFLHTTILEKNWNLAYKIFCTIIKFLETDLRTIWPLGLEILRGKNSQLVAEGKPSILKTKNDRFFQWLTTFFKQSISLPISESSNAPVFRTTSKNHAAFFVVTSFWSLIDRGEYKKVIDDLEALLLDRPFSVEGVFPFMMALCYLAENNMLSNAYATAENEKGELYTQMSSNFEKLERNLERCKELDFIYPEDVINEQTKFILLKIKRADDDDEEEDYDEGTYGYESEEYSNDVGDNTEEGNFKNSGNQVADKPESDYERETDYNEEYQSKGHLASGNNPPDNETTVDWELKEQEPKNNDQDRLNEHNETNDNTTLNDKTEYFDANSDQFDNQFDGNFDDDYDNNEDSIPDRQVEQDLDFDFDFE